MARLSDLSNTIRWLQMRLIGFMPVVAPEEQQVRTQMQLKRSNLRGRKLNMKVVVLCGLPHRQVRDIREVQFD